MIDPFTMKKRTYIILLPVLLAWTACLLPGTALAQGPAFGAQLAATLSGVPAGAPAPVSWLLLALAAVLTLCSLILMLHWNSRLRRRSMQAVQHLKDESRQRLRSETELGTILASMTSLVMEVDSRGTIVRVVPTRYEFRQYSPEELEGRNLGDLLPEKSWRHLFALLQQVIRQGANLEVEHPLELAGARLTFLLSVSALGEDSVLVVGRDISERKRYEEELSRRTFFDSVTGLANRALLLDRLQRAMARSQRRGGAQCAVISLNLDRFRLINESLGHDMGDALIKATGKRIGGCLRQVDTVSRFVADEFVLLLDEIEDRREALRVAARIQEALNRPFVLEGQEVYTSASLGIAYSEPHYDKPEDLVRDAHAAMQCSRSRRKGGCEVFHSAMHERAAASLQLETDLRRAVNELHLEEGGQLPQFTLHFQPIVSLQSGRTVGLEGLVRWNHPSRGLVSPAEFIPLAEETGCILELGAWVLRCACSRLALVNATLPEDAPLSMSVNISARQLQQENLAQLVADCIAAAGIAPGLLNLELTESMVMDNPGEAGAVLRELKSLGVGLAMDDFGTGYSSLSHLYQFPFNLLKIDRSFTSRMQGSACMHGRIIEAILAMASSMGMSVVAEGVEAAHQAQRLVDMGCHLAQGYHFARPLDAAALARHLTLQMQQPRLHPAPGNLAAAAGSLAPQA